jgi:glyoxylase-like metal-dependent hydrolase (beta-lactamase superfamily II)
VKEVAEGVWHLNTFFFPNGVNAYLVGDVLIDAGGRQAAKRILRDLEGRTITAHALTHTHADHQGSSHAVCTALGIPYWVPEGEADLAEDAERIPEGYPDTALSKFFIRLFVGPGHPVDGRLREGDEVAGFTVLETPGHSPGGVSFWRESDRVLILGDVLNNMDVITGLPGLREPKKSLTPDPERNRESIRRLGPLEPSLVLFGHGGPLRNTRKFVDFCAGV